MDVTKAARAVLHAADRRRQEAAADLDDDVRTELGQFFTPIAVARFIASLPELPTGGIVRLLDPGAGTGALTAALVARIIEERPDLRIQATAFELDSSLIPYLTKTVSDCAALADLGGTQLTFRILESDFLEWGVEHLCDPDERFDLVIMNPPYRKVNVNSDERRALSSLGVDVTNLYPAFLAMSAALLSEGAQITAITPRSFSNGPYFRSFRRYFLGLMAFDRFHIFESRSKVFAEDAVLQENVIFSAHRFHAGELPETVRVSTSHGPSDTPMCRTVLHSDIVQPHDPELFVHIVANDLDAAVARTMARLPTRLRHLGLEVSTGRVVDFRTRANLRSEWLPGDVPLVYPGHISNGAMRWPDGAPRKPSALVSNADTASLVFPAATYVVVKRFTAKEERRRVAAAVFNPPDVPSALVAFENHLNVFHDHCRGLSPGLARGLSAWLNSTVVDRYVRSFNGHTQINATDLRRLPYPMPEQLVALGSAMPPDSLPPQEEIDALVTRCVAEMEELAA